MRIVRREVRSSVGAGFLATAVAVAVLMASNPVRADAAAGEQLAKRWCATCHIVGGGAQQSVPQGPPTFHSIAESGKTPDQLRAFLTKPHGAMPDLALTSRRDRRCDRLHREPGQIEVTGK